MSTRFAAYAPLVLRIGLGAVMLWFGYQQLTNSQAWVIWVPEWTAMLGMAPATIVLLNGLFEVAAGLLLILGIFVPFISLLLFLHLGIIVFDIGLTPIGVRDIGIAVGTLALAMLGSGPYSLMPKREALHDTSL